MEPIEQKRVLIIDDEVDLVELIKEDLSEKNYSVSTAFNGQEALSLIEKSGLPDAILLDMNMPIMDGWVFATKFNDKYGRICPVIIMTAEDDSRTRAMEIGADSCIGKPFDLNSLDLLLQSILGE